MKSGANLQRGVSLSGFIGVVIVAIVIAILGLKIGPVYMQDKSIKSKFDEVAHDPELKNAQESEIRAAFGKRAVVAEITNIKLDDIEISKNDSGITLSANYAVKVPLVGNASLLFEFNTSSASK